MRFNDLFARLIIALGIMVVAADQVGGNAGVVVCIDLAVFQPPRGLEDFVQGPVGVGFKRAEQQFIARFVIIGRFTAFHLIFCAVGQCPAEVVRLDFIVPIAGFAAKILADPREQPAGRVVLDNIGTDTGRNTVVLVIRRGDAVQRFTVCIVGFTTDHIADIGFRHQIALIRTIEEHFGGEFFSRFGCDRPNGGSLFLHTVGQIQPLVRKNGDLVSIFLYPFVQHFQCHFWFKSKVDAFVILFADPLVKFVGQAPDHTGVANIGVAQATGSQSADTIRIRLNHRNRFPHFGCLNGRDNTGGIPTINHNVVHIPFPIFA